MNFEFSRRSQAVLSDNAPANAIAYGVRVR